MTTLRQCIDLLDRNDVSYVHTRHANAYRAQDLARAERLPASRVAKTVVFCADKEYGIALLPADRTINLEELTSLLEVPRIRLASESEVVKLAPESEVGAMPPFCVLFDLPVDMDQRLAPDNFIVFSAGTHRDAIHMQLRDYLRLAQPVIMRFSKREGIAA
jgi:Ala-tRNA(Pro) deacylase